MFEDDIDDELITCSNCGYEFVGDDEDDCPQCDELSIPQGATCEWCDLPAEYTVDGEFACEYHHEMAYPID